MQDKNVCEICGRTAEEVQVAYCSSAKKYLCSKHKNQWIRNGKFKSDEKQIKTCEVCGSTSEDTTVYWCSAANKMLCVKHRAQFLKYGHFLSKTKRDPNEIIIHEDCAEIVLDNIKAEPRMTAKIDLEDVEKCKKHHWFCTEMMGNSRYAKCIEDGVNTGLHRYVLDYNGDYVVDHINRDGLDNRKKNLRIVSTSENCVNSRTRSATGEKNIYYKKNKFQVQIIRHYKTVYTESFDAIDEAVAARDNFIKEYNLINNRKV